jgi:acyl-CoA reductase-like NAD-dependent aldehyde dehydrogenase
MTAGLARAMLTAMWSASDDRPFGPDGDCTDGTAAELGAVLGVVAILAEHRSRLAAVTAGLDRLRTAEADAAQRFSQDEAATLLAAFGDRLRADERRIARLLARIEPAGGMPLAFTAP